MSLQVVLRSSEVKLVEALHALDDPEGWVAVHFRLADLLNEYKSEYQVKIAVNLINDLLKDNGGGIFLMSDNSIVVLADGMPKTLLNKLIFQLRYLYMDDPLAYTESGQENPDFAVSYDLGRDWGTFSDWASRRLALTTRRANPEPEKRAVKPVPIMTSPSPGSARLGAIEHELRQADLLPLIRRQPVCAALPNVPVRRVFDELYIHIAALRQSLTNDTDAFSNRWLFKYLTHILDERMLTQIRQNPDNYLDSPVSLNLNTETLLSSFFTEFDAMMKPSDKISIVIEVPVVDVFADFTGFMAAREEAQKLGYRVCLDGLTAKSFSHIYRDKLMVDLVKVQWNAATAGDLNNKENREFAEAVQRNGTNRVVLCRCDNKQAVEYGQSLGISLFQGYYLDGIVDPNSKVKN